MLQIINPYFKIDPEKNIFKIRKTEYDSLEETIREILRPAEEAGFEIIEFGWKDSYAMEIERTLKKNLVIKLKKGEQAVDLSMQIPKLFENNYLVIGGKRKIPIFQLYDLPIVTRGKSIKIRTNVASMMITVDEPTKKDPYFISLSFMSGKVPLALVFYAFFGLEEVANKFSLNSVNYVAVGTSKSNNDKTIEEKQICAGDIYTKFLNDLKGFYSESYTKEDFTDEMGKYFPSYDAKKKGELVIYALDLIPKVDVMTKKFLTTDSLLNEISLLLINGANIDDSDLRNKRLRCFEYIIIQKVSKAIYDLLINNKSPKNKKFNINSTQILSDCNISDIVQFDTAINPIEQLTYLTRCSLVGPGGFTKENIPAYLRDITPTMFGRICPVDTPDRENCGVLQSVIPNVKLDENLRFTDEILEKQPISVSVSMVPFLEHDDQTRLQMSSSQMRQAINLSQFDQPLIQSGCEGIYSDYTYFVRKARKNGEVVYIDIFWLIVIYEDKDYDIFNITDRKTYVENIDIMNVYVEVGDKVKYGDILAESNFCKNGKINFGKNLLTAVMPYYGYNYEDAIVISDRLIKEDIFTSIHFTDLSFILPSDKILLSLEKDRYKPLPSPRPNIEFEEPGKDEAYYRKKKRELILTGNPYAIMKELSDNPMNYYSIFEEKNVLLSKKDSLITNVTIYPNEYNSSINQFKDWVERKFQSQKDQETKIQTVIHNFLPKAEATRYIKDHSLDKFSYRGKFKLKGELINGMLIQIHGFYSRKIQIGDKIGNRHGNKGVISKIVPHEKMPRLEDGRNADICINPLGTISRMNVGQLFELHLGMSINDLRINMNRMVDEGKDQKELKEYFLNYIKIVDNTDNNWYYKQIEAQVDNSEIDKDFIKDLFLIQPPFESTSYEKLHEACKYTKTKLEYKVYDPISDLNLVNGIGVGVMYFFRMIHISESRLSARGIGTYTKRTMQPPGGRNHHGGQRVGEMETCCFIGHDGLQNLFEVLTAKSDCIDLKNSYIRQNIGSEFIKEGPKDDITPESVKLLESYLKIIGIEI